MPDVVRALVRQEEFAAINSQTRSNLRGRAARKNAFSLAKTCSIGLPRTGVINRRAHLGLLARRSARWTFARIEILRTRIKGGGFPLGNGK
jgi:hypothetical protein